MKKIVLTIFVSVFMLTFGNSAAESTEAKYSAPQPAQMTMYGVGPYGKVTNYSPSFSDTSDSIKIIRTTGPGSTRHMRDAREAAYAAEIGKSRGTVRTVNIILN